MKLNRVITERDEAAETERELYEANEKLNNIARIVGEAKADFAKNLFSTILTVEVDCFIADLEAALVGKEQK